MFNQQRRSVDKEILLRQHFFKPQELYNPGNLEKFLIGLSTQPTQKVDPYFTKEVLYFSRNIFRSFLLKQ